MGSHGTPADVSAARAALRPLFADAQAQITTSDLWDPITSAPISGGLSDESRFERWGLAWFATPPLPHACLVEAIGRAFELDGGGVDDLLTGVDTIVRGAVVRTGFVEEDTDLRGIAGLAAWCRSPEGSRRLSPYLGGTPPEAFWIDRVPVLPPGRRPPRTDHAGCPHASAETLIWQGCVEASRRVEALLRLEPPAVIRDLDYRRLLGAFRWLADACSGEVGDPWTETPGPFFVIVDTPEPNLTLLPMGPEVAPMRPIGVAFADDESALVVFPFAHVHVRLGDGRVLATYPAPGLLPRWASRDGRYWLMTAAAMSTALDGTPGGALNLRERVVVVRDLASATWTAQLPDELTVPQLFRADMASDGYNGGTQVLAADVVRRREKALMPPLPNGPSDDCNDNPDFWLSADWRSAWVFESQEHLGIFDVETGLPQLDVRPLLPEWRERHASPVDGYSSNVRAFVLRASGAWRVCHDFRVVEDGRELMACRDPQLRAMAFDRAGDRLLLATTAELAIADVANGARRSVLAFEGLAGELLDDGMFAGADVTADQRQFLRLHFGTRSNLLAHSAKEVAAITEDAASASWGLPRAQVSRLLDALKARAR
jgi:hypothetical protein